MVRKYGNPQIATFAEGPQGRYDNPMPELTSSPQSGYLNSATSMRATRHVSSKTCYLLFMSMGKGRVQGRGREEVGADFMSWNRNALATQCLS